MMNRNKILNLANALSEDLTIYEMQNGTIYLTVEDFEGFDEEWCEVFRDLVNPDGVAELRDRLYAEALNVSGPLGFPTFHFADCSVRLCFASSDI